MSETWNHCYATLDGVRIHYLVHGAGRPLLLLHGWPEFWLTWRKNIGPLAEHFQVIVPDLRGFGESDKPDLDDLSLYGPEVMAEDLRALADHLGLARFGLVAHDVGAFVAQAFARRWPQRLAGLHFFNCPYPGVGARWAAADHLQEIWYQSFHQLPWAHELVGHDRETCELYLRHFLGHWAHDPHAFDADLPAWVDNFLRPGNLRGGFNWYRAIDAARRAIIRGDAPAVTRIAVPTAVLWGESDPVLRAEWVDRLPEFFTDVRVDTAPHAGHYVHYERPKLANRSIREFFDTVGWD